MNKPFQKEIERLDSIPSKYHHEDDMTKCEVCHDIRMIKRLSEAVEKVIDKIKEWEYPILDDDGNLTLSHTYMIDKEELKKKLAKLEI